jgi:hypothetical protein
MKNTVPVHIIQMILAKNLMDIPTLKIVVMSMVCKNRTNYICIYIYYDITVVPERCDVDCGLGQECQWLQGEEMCVCSESSCSSSKIKQQSICASNNMTFKSECAMEAWKCINQQSALYKKYDGECQSKRFKHFINKIYSFLVLFNRKLSKC